MQKSIAEIITEAGNKKKKEDKVNVLKANLSPTLKNILILTYDKTKELMVPNEAPPYKPSDYVDAQGMLYKKSRVLKYIVKGFHDDTNLKQIKRESIFIELLESVDKEDAKVLCQMVERKPFKGLSKATVNEALDGVIN